MDTLIERHPVAFLGVAIAIAALLATFYIVLSNEEVLLSWFAGFPHTTLAFASPLRIGMTLAVPKTASI